MSSKSQPQISAIEFGQLNGFRKNDMFVLEKKFGKSSERKTADEWHEQFCKDFDYKKSDGKPTVVEMAEEELKRNKTK